MLLKATSAQPASYQPHLTKHAYKQAFLFVNLYSYPVLAPLYSQAQGNRPDPKNMVFAKLLPSGTDIPVFRIV